jgi:hypothetical protein
MSWDAIIMRFGNAKTVDELPPDFKPPPIANSMALKTTLRRLFPDADHDDKRSYVVGDDFWLELNHGLHTNTSGDVSALSVRSNAGTGVIPHLQQLCDLLGARLFDIQMGEFADFSSSTEKSMHLFTDWRDRALSQHRDQA